MKTTSVFLGFLILIVIGFLVSPVLRINLWHHSYRMYHQEPLRSGDSSSTLPELADIMDMAFWRQRNLDQPEPDTYLHYCRDYTVTLIATNAAGSDTLTRMGYITAIKATSVPATSFVTNVTSGSVPFSVQFLIPPPTPRMHGYGHLGMEELHDF